MPYFEDQVSITVEDDKEYRVTAIGGEGQKTTISINTVDGPNGQAPSVTDLLIGKGSALRGKSCVCTAIITDHNPQHDRTTFTVWVNGNKAKGWNETTSVANGTNTFELRIDFV